MPNVAGREFPYTPEGLQAAERYRQALGMRNGGLMGFRPLGYADGGDADGGDADGGDDFGGRSSGFYGPNTCNYSSERCSSVAGSLFPR